MNEDAAMQDEDKMIIVPNRADRRAAKRKARKAGA